MKLYVFPGNIEEEILQIGTQQIPYMRTAQFSELVKNSEDMLLKLIGCTKGRVLFYTASGTGAMDAVVANYVTRQKQSLIIAGGSFGYRWKHLCDYYHCPNEVFDVPFAKNIDYDQLEEKVKRTCPDVLLCQHHETSTGQLYNLSRLSVICKKYKVKLIVDAISSFLTDPLNMDALGIDICIISSQKGLNIPPGLSFVVLSADVSTEPFAHKGFYFDFSENLKNLERGQTPYSPATTLFLQLHTRLEQDLAIGCENIIYSVRERAMYFRDLCAKNRWIVLAETPSNCITGFSIPRNGEILFTELLKQNIYIMPSGIPDYFRVSHSGVQTKEGLSELAICIQEIENH